MKHLSRLLSVALISLLLLPLAACSGDGGEPTTTTAAPAVTTEPTPVTTEAPETELKPELPERRFDNTGSKADAELVVIHHAANRMYYAEPWIYAENLNGDIINDAVYRRNMVIEDKYGITIVSMVDDNPANTAGLSAQAQSDEYDVVMSPMKHVGTLALQGLLYNIADLPYVNYEMPWWDINCYNRTIIDGKVYGMVSDISMMTLAGTRGIVFNRDMIKNNKLEDPYTLVKEDRWTLEKMGEMSSAVSVDLNGDTKFDDADVYGMLTEDSGANANIVHLATGCGFRYLEFNEQGELKIVYNNEKTINIVEKCRAFLTDPATSYSYAALKTAPGLTGSNYYYGRELFSSDHFLFTQIGAMTMDELKNNNMKSEYGIVPNPKYDENQKEYYHLVDTDTSMLAIPSSNDPADLDRLGILLEDMAYQSSIDVKTAYYDTVIKLRHATVPEMGEMMDIIKNSIGYHYGNVYADLRFWGILVDSFKTGNTASVIQGNLEKYQTIINNTVDKIKALP